MQINIITDGQLMQMEQREFDEAYDRGFGFPGTWCHRCQAWHPWTGYRRAADDRADEARPGHCRALEAKFAEYERPIGGGGPETCTVITCRDGREALFPFTSIQTLGQIGITPESSDEAVWRAVEESEDPECEACDWCECGLPHGVSHVCHGCDYHSRVDGLLAEGYSSVDAQVEACLGGGI